MKRETIENILNFLKEKEDKELPESWFDSVRKLNLVKELETHPDGTQYRYEDHLELNNSNITKLPNDLYVGGSLRLIGCKQITKLPDDLYVDNDFFLVGCKQITELPNNLYVDKNLVLSYSFITKIPNNLYVGGHLYVNNTPLAKKYSNEKIREMIISKGGIIKGQITIQ